MALMKSCRLMTINQRMRAVAPMLRLEECHSMGGNMSREKSRENVAKRIADLYGLERSSASPDEVGIPGSMVCEADFESVVGILIVVDQTFDEDLDRCVEIDEAKRVLAVALANTSDGRYVKDEGGGCRIVGSEPLNTGEDSPRQSRG